MRRRQTFDTSKELLVQRYKQGIRLVRPKAPAESTTNHSVERLFNLPTQIYFLDYKFDIVNLNPAQLNMLGVSTLQEALGKNSADFINKPFRENYFQTNSSVITSSQMKIAEEGGELLDGPSIQTISFKFPWYQNEKIIGLFGCSINIDPDHIGDFGKTMAQFMATGLLGHAPSSPAAFLPELKDCDIYFSKRERQVLGLLVRGKTAKEIGVLLQISKRTAENHIKSAKAKASCSSKSELIDKFVDQFI